MRGTPTKSRLTARVRGKSLEVASGRWGAAEAIRTAQHGELSRQCPSRVPASVLTMLSCGRVEINFMRRNTLAFIVWLSTTVLPNAQETAPKVPVIGWLSPATTQSYQQAGPGSPGPQLLRDSLAKHGFID